MIDTGKIKTKQKYCSTILHSQTLTKGGGKKFISLQKKGRRKMDQSKPQVSR
jgi:hypothetical protein